MFNCANRANSGLSTPLETAEPYRQKFPRTYKYSSLRVLLCQSNIISDGFSGKPLPLKEQVLSKIKKITGDLDTDLGVEGNWYTLLASTKGSFVCEKKRSEEESVV